MTPACSGPCAGEELSGAVDIFEEVRAGFSSVASAPAVTFPHGPGDNELWAAWRDDWLGPRCATAGHRQSSRPSQMGDCGAETSVDRDMRRT